MASSVAYIATQALLGTEAPPPPSPTHTHVHISTLSRRNDWYSLPYMNAKGDCSRVVCVCVCVGGAGGSQTQIEPQI